VDKGSQKNSQSKGKRKVRGMTYKPVGEKKQINAKKTEAVLLIPSHRQQGSMEKEVRKDLKGCW